ncbi:MAG: AzlD domain-containing protein [Rhodospirillales bacterium]|nr:AzlD domain-containing protein [Rhodospirillales bacterium]MBO6788225.1 AzlD domain-containing protein [Rhodospirillales bacterium]
MSSGIQEMSATGIWALLFLAIASTYLWRGLGTMIAARIDPESRVLQWVSCVAYGLLAALISRILFLPVGVLEDTLLVDRLGATAFGFLLFFVFKRHIGAGTLGAAGAFMLLVWARTHGIL